MKILTLKRTHRLPDVCFGILDFDGIPFCVTIELPWRDNKKDVSHIPCGEYLMDRAISPKRGYEVYWIRNVKNRDEDVQIHVANTVYDILGCIGIGRGFTIFDRKEKGKVLGITDSSYTFNIFMNTLRNDPQVKLVIAEI